MKKAIVTVAGHDRVGIIAAVTTKLSKFEVNILEITQTVKQEYFTMIMLTDIEKCSTSYENLVQEIRALGPEYGVDIQIQHQDIFDAMHRI